MDVSWGALHPLRHGRGFGYHGMGTETGGDGTHGGDTVAKWAPRGVPALREALRMGRAVGALP